MRHFLLGLLLAAITLPLASQVMAQRPIYVITHRANDLDDIDDAIRNGANAIELDLRLCRNKTVWRVNHDNCGGSTTLQSWLRHFSSLPGRTAFAAVIFDIKAADVPEDKMHEIRDLARTHISRDVLTVFGVGKWENRFNLEPIMHDLRENEAVTIDFTDGFGFSKHLEFFAEAGVNNQVYADGISAFLATPDSVRLNTIFARNDPLKRSKLTYSWTYENEAPIKEVLLDWGLDGILINDCDVFCANHLGDDGMENAKDVLRKNPDKIRLARRSDLARWGFTNSEPALPDRGMTRRRARNSADFRTCKDEELSLRRKGLEVTFACMSVEETRKEAVVDCRKRVSEQKRRGLTVTEVCSAP